MLVRCACGPYRLNPENATYVRDGVPLCHEETCRKVAERRQQPTPARDVPVGTSWAFTDHRTLAEVAA